MAYKKEICYYRSGPIERDPGSAFHAKNDLDRVFTEEFGFKIVGDTFEHLKTQNCPQEVYGSRMKKLRDQGRFHEYCQNELLLVMSFREIRKKAAFLVIKPAPEASGGTTSETVMSWPRFIPKLVIAGPHGERILDNDSTFMIRMLASQGLIFSTGCDVINFVREHIHIFKQGRNAIRQLIVNTKKDNPFINDWPKPLWDERFEGKTVILYGRPGCGKDTQARKLQHLCGFKFFGSGVELRKLYSKFPHLRKNLGEGELAPSWLIIQLISQKFIGLEKFEPIVFSGTPKMLIEAEAFLDISKSFNRKPAVIAIDINEELSKERITLRRNCDSCEESFCGIEFVENPICPHCGGLLTAREENISEEAITKIFSWYKTDVETVIKFFEDMGVVTHIDGNHSREEIFKDILEILRR